MGKPLTADEIKALQVGDWLWVVDIEYDEEYYIQLKGVEVDFITVSSNLYSHEFFDFENYGKTWLAYKNKEQVGS